MMFSGCSTTAEKRVQAAAQATSASELVKDATDKLQEVRPKAPAGCRVRFRAGVSTADSADAALLRYDSALTQANDRLKWCADWYDTSNGHKVKG